MTDWQSLAAGAGADTAVLILDSGTDGLTQISDYLSIASTQGLPLLQSIQIISHGSVGSLQLGSSTISSNNLGLYSKQLAKIGSSLTDTGDILLYGCNVAAGQAGLDFINQLSALTNADVAASNDITGSAVLNGNWQLEASTGSIEATIVISKVASNAYKDILLVNTIPTFAFDFHDGKVTTDISDRSTDTGNSVTVQLDGKILVSGLTQGINPLYDPNDPNSLQYSYDFALVRYNKDGSLDSSFDGDGKVTTDFSNGSSDSGECVTV
ncbi:MAG: DUF4347 domain-containing protein, partial [Methylococcales bacterium]|nr:DUF4347 domain-containing protein [Methylococcales bacterium]